MSDPLQTGKPIHVTASMSTVSILCTFDIAFLNLLRPLCRIAGLDTYSTATLDLLLVGGATFWEGWPQASLYMP